MSDEINRKITERASSFLEIKETIENYLKIMRENISNEEFINNKLLEVLNFFPGEISFLSLLFTMPDFNEFDEDLEKLLATKLQGSQINELKDILRKNMILKPYFYELFEREVIDVKNEWSIINSNAIYDITMKRLRFNVEIFTEKGRLINMKNSPSTLLSNINLYLEVFSDCLEEIIDADFSMEIDEVDDIEEEGNNLERNLNNIRIHLETLKQKA